MQTPAFYAALDIDCKRLVLGIVNYGRTRIEHNVWVAPQNCPLTSGWANEIIWGPKQISPPAS